MCENSPKQKEPTDYLLKHYQHCNYLLLLSTKRILLFYLQEKTMLGNLKLYLTITAKKKDYEN